MVNITDWIQAATSTFAILFTAWTYKQQTILGKSIAQSQIDCTLIEVRTELLTRIRKNIDIICLQDKTYLVEKIKEYDFVKSFIIDVFKAKEDIKKIEVEYNLLFGDNGRASLTNIVDECNNLYSNVFASAFGINLLNSTNNLNAEILLAHPDGVKTFSEFLKQNLEEWKTAENNLNNYYTELIKEISVFFDLSLKRR